MEIFARKVTGMRNLLQEKQGKKNMFCVDHGTGIPYTGNRNGTEIKQNLQSNQAEGRRSEQ
jgi:hypothetical protein